MDEGARRHGVVVAFTDRTGVGSEPPYDTLNLSLSVGDRREDVLANRRRVAAALDLAPGDLVLARQQHGTTLLRAGRRRRGLAGEGDGLLTRHRGPVLGMLAADCATVVVVGSCGLAVAHAGWRGLAGGMVPRAVAAVAPAWAAWVGPAIGACCYEVGPEVVHAFERVELPVNADRAHVEVGRTAVTAVRAAGVEQVTAVGGCTACGDRWFSHRRDAGRTGRHGAFAALVRPTGERPVLS
ncbi:peptidoglycan editing factor PgeF [soil metagenome]